MASLPRLVTALTRFSSVAAIVVGLLGAISLISWISNVHLLEPVSGNPTSMPLSEAIGFVLAGTAMLLLRPARFSEASRARRWLGGLMAAAVAALGAVALGQHLFNAGELPDQPLLTFGPFDEILAPMTLASAVNFFLAGLAVLFLNTETPRGNRPAEPLAFAETLVVFFIFVVYVFSVTSPHIVAFSHTTFEAWLAFLLLGFAVLFARPDRGLMSLVTSEGAGGILVRRMLPAVICIPLAIGWLWLGGKRSDLYHTEVGIALVVVWTVIILGVLIWFSARSLAKTDSKRRRAEEALRRERNVLRTLIDNLPDYVYVKDKESRFLVNNFAHIAVLGATRPEEVLGRTDFDYFAEELADKYRADEKGLMEIGKSLVNHEEFVADRQGQTRWLLTTKVPLKDGAGEIIGLVGISRDISDRKQAEQALAKQTQELARSNAELEQFAYIASHDLQEPLRMVASYVQLLARRYKGQLDAEADEFIDFAVGGVTRMQALVNDLLTFSRVGNELPALETTDLEQVLDRVLDNLKVATAESGAVVTHDRLPNVEADPSQLAQLFQNLVSNAIKFHGPTPPRIHIGAAHRNGEWVFSVGDNGIGFESKYAERIFLIFQRLHNRITYPGTGIGLAICKKIVEHNGGRIWAESEPGKGSTFRFTLPLKMGERT